MNIIQDEPSAAEVCKLQEKEGFAEGSQDNQNTMNIDWQKVMDDPDYPIPKKKTRKIFQPSEETIRRISNILEKILLKEDKQLVKLGNEIWYRKNGDSNEEIQKKIEATRTKYREINPWKIENALIEQGLIKIDASYFCFAAREIMRVRQEVKHGKEDEAIEQQIMVLKNRIKGLIDQAPENPEKFCPLKAINYRKIITDIRIAPDGKKFLQHIFPVSDS